MGRETEPYGSVKHDTLSSVKSVQPFAEQPPRLRLDRAYEMAFVIGLSVGTGVAQSVPSAATSSIVRPLITDRGSLLTGLRRASASSSRRLISSHWGFSPPCVRRRV